MYPSSIKLKTRDKDLLKMHCVHRCTVVSMPSAPVEKFRTNINSKVDSEATDLRWFRKWQKWSYSLSQCWINLKQGGRLAPAYFSPNYKYFDQLLQTVTNKTTVLILVFKEFLQTSIRPLISVLYAKGYHDFPLKNFCLTVTKNFVEEPFCAVFQKISGTEKC